MPLSAGREGREYSVVRNETFYFSLAVFPSLLAERGQGVRFCVILDVLDYETHKN